MGGNAELKRNLLLLSAVVVIAGVFYALAPAKKPVPSHNFDGSENADIRGLLNEWDADGAKIYAYIEVKPGQFQEHLLMLDERTRAYRAERGEALRSVEQASLAQIHSGVFASIYLRRPAVASGSDVDAKVVDTIVYWE